MSFKSRLNEKQKEAGRRETATVCEMVHLLKMTSTISSVSLCCYVCLFVLRFYGPVNPMGSCRARSVYLTTRLLGRLSPLSG